MFVHGPNGDNEPWNSTSLFVIVAALKEGILIIFCGLETLDDIARVSTSKDDAFECS